MENAGRNMGLDTNIYNLNYMYIVIVFQAPSFLLSVSHFQVTG